MDVKQKFKAFADNIKRSLLDRGSLNAIQYLNTTTVVSHDSENPAEALQSEAYIQGIITSLETQRQIDLDRIIQAFNQLERLGVSAGVASAMQMGMPLHGLFVSYTPSTGRLGDFLSQIRRLIAAKYVRNLIVSFPLPEVIASGPSLVVGGDQILSTRKPLIYELGSEQLNNFMSLDSDSSTLASDCPWILRYLPSCFFDAFTDEGLPFNDAYTALHLRGGDALHEADIVLYQPPLSYYLNAILSSKCSRLALVSEPDDPLLDRVNPLRTKIFEFCTAKCIEVVEVSNDDFRLDVATLFRASQVIAGTSSLGRELSLASSSCQAIFTPSSELRIESDSELVGKYCLEGLAPSISVVDNFCYPSADEWKNLGLRYQWLLNN